MPKAFILHRFPYQDADYIVKAYTDDLGLISFVAKGARRNKKNSAGLLQPFLKVEIEVFGKSDLKKLRGIELLDPLRPLSGKVVYCGFYLNELMTYLCPQFVPSDEIFQLYDRTVSNLGALKEDQFLALEAILRFFEFMFLRYLGIGPNLSHDSEDRPIQLDSHYVLRVEHLPEKIAIPQSGSFQGEVLRSIESCQFDDKTILKEAKRLFKYWIAYYCNGKVFKSREMFSGSVINSALTPD